MRTIRHVETLAEAQTHRSGSSNAQKTEPSGGKNRAVLSVASDVALTTVPRDVDVVVIGAGQAGLSSAYFLRHFGFEPARDFVMFDHAAGPGGAWQYRWTSLDLATTHGIHDLPAMSFPAGSPDTPVAQAVADYFSSYEKEFELPVLRPVDVHAVRYAHGDRFEVNTSAGTWTTRALINATGSWDRPFWPHYPGRERFRGRQLHTADYRHAAEFEGQHVVVVGAGASATQLLMEIAEVTTTTWVTRHEPVFRDGPFTHDLGRKVVSIIDERVRAGLPPGSVASATGIIRTSRVAEAIDNGVLRRHRMFDRITETGVAWDDGTEQPADVILWCTGFRPAVDHLAPLGLRTSAGGIRMDGTRAVDEPRLHLVGYGPSASTVGATRAGRAAARAISMELAVPLSA